MTTLFWFIRILGAFCTGVFLQYLFITVISIHIEEKELWYFTVFIRFLFAAAAVGADLFFRYKLLDVTYLISDLLLEVGGMIGAGILSGLFCSLVFEPSLIFPWLDL